MYRGGIKKSKELIWEKNLENGGQNKNRWKKPGKNLRVDEKWWEKSEKSLSPKIYKSAYPWINGKKNLKKIWFFYSIKVSGNSKKLNLSYYFHFWNGQLQLLAIKIIVIVIVIEKILQ